MSLRGRLRTASRWLRGRFSSSGAILLYHRIAQRESDPWQLSVTHAHFAEHLEVVRRRGVLLRVRELVDALREGKTPRRFLLVTFDDGYEDNLREAKPLLERYDVPATISLTAGWLGQGAPFWWDELEALLLKSDGLPETLRLEMPDGPHELPLGNDEGLDEQERKRHVGWRAWGDEAPTRRHAAYLTLHALLPSLGDPEREQVMEELRARIGPLPKPSEAGRPLSREQAVELARGGLVEVGAHSLTHPRLAQLAPAAQREEIAGSRKLLEQVLAGPVTSFAYPYGGPEDYTARTASLVREEGFSAACVSMPGTIGPRTDPWRLPRFHIEDCDGEQLDRRISRWLAA